MNEIKKQLEDLGFVQDEYNNDAFEKNYNICSLAIFKSDDETFSAILVGAVDTRKSFHIPDMIDLGKRVNTEWITDFDKLMSHK